MAIPSPDEALRLRLRQQVAVAEFGQWALMAEEPSALMAHAARIAAEALGTDRCAVFEPRPDGTWRRVGIGWDERPPEGLDTALDAEAPLITPGGTAFVRVGERDALFGVLAAQVGAGAFSPDAAHFLSAVARTLAGALSRLRTEQALRDSEARARAIVETTVDAVISIDERGRIELFNPAAERIFGYTADEVRGRNVNVLMPEPYRSEHDGYIQAYRETGRRRIIGIGREVKGLRKDGSIFPMDLAVSEVHLEGRTIFTGLIRDISERRRLELEVLRSAEEERRRIGQDLHDGLGQQLTGIGLILRGLARQLDAEGSAAAAEAHEVAQFVKEADAFARMLARGLVQVELEENGLEAALSRLAANVERLFGVTCTIEVKDTHEDMRPIPHVTHLFRIAQEAISNAVRHGRAQHIVITLAVGASQVRLLVADDGTGFPGEVHAGGSTSAPARPDDNRGLGVRIMHYRAQIIGGTLDIRPGFDGGTVVSCTVPLDSVPPDGRALGQRR